MGYVTSSDTAAVACHSVLPFYFSLKILDGIGCNHIIYNQMKISSCRNGEGRERASNAENVSGRRRKFSILVSPFDLIETGLIGVTINVNIWLTLDEEDHLFLSLASCRSFLFILPRPDWMNEFECRARQAIPHPRHGWHLVFHQAHDG